MRNKARVFVSGVGIVSPYGCGRNKFFDGLYNGINSITLHAGMIGSFVPEITMEEQIDKLNIDNDYIIRECIKLSRRASLTVKTAVLACAEAYAHAELSKVKQLDDYKKGIVVAGSNIEQKKIYEYFQRYKDKLEFIPPSYSIEFLDTNLVGILSQIFGLKSEGFTVGGASASGNLAIIKGMQMIQLGLADICFVVGGANEFSDMELSGFRNLNAMGGKNGLPEEACRPFDKQHNGFVLGQAGACIVLESYASVCERRIRSNYELISGIQLLDGNKNSNPNLKNEIKVMQEVLLQGGITNDKVDYINAHGTSTPLGDETEAEAIETLFVQGSRKPYINSTKGLVGHCMYSAGILEAVAVLLQMENDFLHPNINLHNPINDRLNFVKDTSIQTEINVAISNSFGFGGINTSILLKKAQDI